MTIQDGSNTSLLAKKSYAQSSMRCPVCEGATTGVLWRAEGLEIVRCRSCGLYAADRAEWKYPYAARDYYSVADYAGLNPDRPPVRHRVQQITRFVQSGRCVDLGCGLGETAVALSRRGFEVHGVEESLNAVTFLTEQFPTVHWHNEQIERFLERNENFDVITLFHVLEHMLVPRDLSRKAVDHLNRNGLLVVEVPDVSGGQARLHGKRWQHWLPHHVNYFDLKTLRLLLEPLGLRLRDVERKYHTSFPQGVFWKDAIHHTLARLRFHDVITTYWQK